MDKFAHQIEAMCIQLWRCAKRYAHALQTPDRFSRCATQRERLRAKLILRKHRRRDRLSTLHQNLYKLLEQFDEELGTILEKLQLARKVMHQPKQALEIEVASKSIELSDSCSDITDCKQVEEELCQLNTALENAVEGISRLDTQGRYIAVNKAYASILGYQPTEMMGMAWQQTVHPSERQKLMHSYQQMLKTGKAEIEARGVRKDGSIFYKQVVMVAAYDSRQRFIGHHCFAKDITERKWAEEALKQAKQELEIRVEERTAQLKLANEQLHREIADRKQVEQSLRKSEATNRALINAIPDLMIRMTRDGTYLDLIAAKNFRSMVPAPDVRGKNLYDVMPLHIAQQRMHYIEQALLTRETQIYEFQLEWDDGTITHEEARIVVSGDSEVLVIVRDITERKQMEDALTKSEERYRHMIETTSEGVWIIDAENKTVFVNHTMAQMLGYTQEEMLGMPIFALMHSEWHAIAALAILHLRKGNRETFDFQLCRKDGSQLWMMVSANPMFDQAGQYTGALGMFTDITERKQAEVELQQSEQKYRNLFHNSLVGMFRTCLTDGTVMDANAAALKMFGYDSYEGIKTVDLYVNPADREHLKQLLLEKGFVENFEAQVRRKDGSVFWVSYSARLYAKQGYLEGVMIDITERKLSEEALRAKDKFLQLVLDNIPQFIFWKDRNSVYLGCNYNFARVAGLNNPEEIVGKTDYDLPWTKEESDFYREWDARVMETDTGEYHIIETRLQADGKQIWLDTSKIPLHDLEGNVVGILGSYEDITDRQRQQEKIRYQALHDLLTGLANRTLFNERLSVSLTQACKSQRMLAVMFLDLDRFKTINDTLGHAVGDRLLQKVAKRLTSCLREIDTVARWGGDEFILLLPQISNIKDAEKIAQRILDTLKPAINLGENFPAYRGTSLHISTSIGIALYPQDGADAETLLINADAALYSAKKQGRNNYQLYTAAMNSQASELLIIENELHHALKRGEFVLYYQPQTKIATGEITGMEALLRWQHPKLGLVSPAKFIPLAEETGLIVPIGEWVLQTACAQNKAWQDAGLPLVRMSVNLSVRQFQQPFLLNTVAQTLQQTGLSPQFLELEITETIAMQNVELTRSILGELHHMGVHLSIDDFGTGYSSLGYLKEFPLHTLKIDKSFVRDLATEPKNAAIIKAIMSLGKGFNLRVIAEGVETEAEKECLRSFQCEEMQGYLYSMPLSVQEATQLLQATRLMSDSIYLSP